jgi:hypothetical protein
VAAGHKSSRFPVFQCYLFDETLVRRLEPGAWSLEPGCISRLVLLGVAIGLSIQVNALVKRMLSMEVSLESEFGAVLGVSPLDSQRRITRTWRS